MRLLYQATGFPVFSKFVCVLLIQTIHYPRACPMKVSEAIGVEEEALDLPVSGLYITVVYAPGIDHGK